MTFRILVAVFLVHVLAGSASAQNSCDLSAGSAWQPNEGPTDYALHLRPAGELKAVMIFVDFPDAVHTESTSALYDMLVPNSAEWYAEVSYGRMSLNVTPVHAWFMMPKNSSAYGFGDGLTFAEHRAYIADAMAASDAVVDYSQHQIVYVVAAKNSAITYSPAFHAYTGSGVVADGKEIRHSATFGEDIRVARPNYGSHVLIHETGHLIGLPDLYEYGSPLYDALRFAGGWDTMSFTTPGAHFMAWHKRKTDWLEPEQIICLNTGGSIDVTLMPIQPADGGLKAVVVPLGPSTAYVVEVRQLVGQDARLCDKGVLIYTVDATVPNGSGPIRVKRAGNGADPVKIDACGPLYDAPFDLGSGEISTYTDAVAGLTVQILATVGTGYAVRITRDASAQPDLVESALSAPPAVAVLGQKFSITGSTANQGAAASVRTTTRLYLSRDTQKNTGDKVVGKRVVVALAAGATSTGSAQATVPATLPIGAYYLIACADDLKVQAESDETNNCRTAATTVDVRAPDLVESSVSNPPSAVPLGGSFSVTDSVRNQGNATATTTTTRYFLSLDLKKTSVDPLLTGTRTVPSLSPADTSSNTVTVTVPTSVAAGSYYLIACADDLKKSPESNEKNNCRASTTRVLVN